MTHTTAPLIPSRAADALLLQQPDGLAPRPIGRWDRWRAALLAGRLDAELARGLAPEHRWLRAVRATELVRPERRGELADGWAALLDPDRLAARRRFGTGVHPALWLSQHQVLDLVERLRSAAPVSARGVAAARLLLTDGAGPLYRPGSAQQVTDSLLEALRWLDGPLG